MAKVKMAKDHKAALDGANVVTLKKGKTYDVPARFIERWAEKGIISGGKKKNEKKETKAIEESPENK